MKKTLLAIVMLLAACVVTFTCCDETVTKPQQPSDGNSVLSGSEEHEHAFGEWDTVKEANCTEKGLMERVCLCGEKESREQQAKGHTYADGKCTLCEEKDPNAFVPDYTAAEKNTVGSATASGYAAGQGKWIYAAFSTSEIVKMDQNGKNLKSVYKISGGTIMNVNVVGDYIYFYVNGSSESSSYIGKVRTDGTAFEKVLSSVSVSEMLVVKDTIYFTTIKSPYSDYAKECCPLYSMPVSGNGAKQLQDGYVSSLSADDKFIYFLYTPKTGTSTIYRMKHDGSAKAELCTKLDINYIYLSDGKIYFAKKDKYSDGGTIVSIATNGGSYTEYKTVEFYPEWLYVAEGKIFYFGITGQNAGLMQYTISGTSTRMILKGEEPPACCFTADLLLTVSYQGGTKPLSCDIYNPATGKWQKDISLK